MFENKSITCLRLGTLKDRTEKGQNYSDLVNGLHLPYVHLLVHKYTLHPSISLKIHIILFLLIKISLRLIAGLMDLQINALVSFYWAMWHSCSKNQI